ncbi:MAG: type II toxin-antitoxin system Phd/YefM family antitoxin [Armatimonadetes bacterium]|nr:type II toxin-antitoxin system Phd/YefM family antitoxin [Armatimonadota bacterium]
MSNMSVSELRNDLSTTLNRVAFSRERIVLERQGKVVAVLVPEQDLKLLEELEDAYLAAKAAEVLSDPANDEDIPAEAVWKRLGVK